MEGRLGGSAAADLTPRPHGRYPVGVLRSDRSPGTKVPGSTLRSPLRGLGSTQPPPKGNAELSPPKGRTLYVEPGVSTPGGCTDRGALAVNAYAPRPPIGVNQSA